MYQYSWWCCRYYDEDWHADEYETPEQYAKRIWQEMQDRKRAAQRAEQAAFDDLRRSADGRKEWARRQAEESSKKILEEQMAADAAWRAAVAGGSAGPKRADYEARWEFFCTKNVDREIRFSDVPWILPGPGAVDASELKKVVLYGALVVNAHWQLMLLLILVADCRRQWRCTLNELYYTCVFGAGASSGSEQKQRLRKELMRWHPDKFAGKFGRRVVEGDRDRIMERVKELGQALNEMNSGL
jgi:hypothetical protein